LDIREGFAGAVCIPASGFSARFAAGESCAWYCTLSG
jgi:hypothetical protein